MSTLHPKFSQSIYTGLEFNSDVYTKSRNFAIFTPKPDNYMQNLLDRHQTKLQGNKEQDRISEQLRSRRGLALSCTSSPRANFSCMQSTAAHPPEAAGLQNLDNVFLLTEEESRVRTKLTKDVEMARSISQTPRKKDETCNNDNNEETEEQKLKKELSDSQLGSVTQREASLITETVSKMGTHRKGKSWDKSVSSLPLKKLNFPLNNDSFLKHSLDPSTKIRSVTKREKNQVIEDILDKEIMIVQKPDLVKSIMKLREIKALKLPGPSVQACQGVGKISYVYNDYHTKNSNPGYSRNTAGVFYCK